jgi:hypothetical protein
MFFESQLEYCTKYRPIGVLLIKIYYLCRCTADNSNTVPVYNSQHNINTGKLYIYFVNDTS